MATRLVGLENPGCASDWMGCKHKRLAINLGGILTIPGLPCDGVLATEHQNEKINAN